MEQIPKSVKEDRAKRAAVVADKLHQTYLSGCVGQVYPVLYEQERNGKFSGHAPNYMEVLVDGGKALHNRVLSTRIVDTDGSALLGILEETP